MEQNEIVEKFKGCIHCSQIVAEHWAEELNLDRETLMRMAGVFGGGCFEGGICGCVLASLMLLGSQHGHWVLGDTEGNARMIEKVSEFKEAFSRETGSLYCKELTGFDFSVPGELQRAMESGVLYEKCPAYVNAALDILDELL